MYIVPRSLFGANMGRLLTNKTTRFVIYTLIILFLIAHIVLIILYSTPPNVFRTVTDIQNRYVGTYFPQTWNFFAPDPVNNDYGISVQCIDSKSDTQTPLLDVTTSLWKARQANRFSHYDRVARVPESLALNYSNAAFEGDFLDDMCSQNPKQPICERRDESRKANQETQRKNLVKIASSFCADVTNSTSDKARIKLWAGLIPKWSERYSKTKTIVITNDLGIHNLVPIKGFGIWSRYVN
jgi:Family of unknown function (DUF5819)